MRLAGLLCHESGGPLLQMRLEPLFGLLRLRSFALEAIQRPRLLEKFYLAESFFHLCHDAISSALRLGVTQYQLPSLRPLHALTTRLPHSTPIATF